MPVNAIIILVKSTYSKTPYDKWLKDRNIVPLLLVDEKFYADYSHIKTAEPIHDYLNDDLVFQKVVDLSKQYSIVSLFARAESDIIRAATFRDKLLIPGQSRDVAENYRDKNKMKTLVSRKGVRTPRFQCVRSRSELRAFADEVGFPFIVKPLSESGSTGVTLIEHLTQLDTIDAVTLDKLILAEEFIDGDLYHVDGFIYNNELVFAQASKYINDNLCYRDDKYMGSVLLSPNSLKFKSLVSAAQVVIEALGSTRNMVFHGEFWCTDESEVTFCEIASRTGGGMIATSISEIRGVNLDRVWLDAECGHEPEISVNWHAHGGSVWIPPKKGYLQNIPDLSGLDCVIKGDVLAEVNKKYSGGEKSGLYMAGYVLSGRNEEDTIQNVHGIAQQFNNLTIWGDTPADLRHISL